MLVGFFYAFDNGFEIAVIIQGVKGSEYIHAVGSSPINKGFGNIIGVIAVADKILGPGNMGRCDL